MNPDHKLIAPTAVKLDFSLKERLRHLGEIKERSIHWLMKQAIEHYVTEQEQLENLKQETLKRWQEVERGEVITHDEVSGWLDTWDNKN